MDLDQVNSWPFQEARKLLEHIAKKGKVHGDPVTFMTGYGPSGSPHIGTFAEVIRTLWVMRAFDELTEHAYNTRLIMFSDDYDALRKVPDGLPEWMNDHLGKPLSLVPNPDQEQPGATQVMVDKISFAEANNDKLIKFVDDILVHYDGNQVGASPDRSRVSFVSSSRYYKSGKFNKMLDRVWNNYDAVQDIMLPTLGEERRATYSPFMPVMPHNWWPFNQVLQVPVTLREPYSIAFTIPDDAMTRMVVGVHDGNVKLQWKVDWAMRWVHFDVDYEMSGKDLIDSVKASNQICRVLGGTPPLNMTYEMFLDATGAKISKSVGNGFKVSDWLRLGSVESLMLFMFQNPRSAKKLHAGVIPQLEDQWLKMATKAPKPQDVHWHFALKPRTLPFWDLSYSLLLNLAIVAQTRDGEDLMRYLEAGIHVGPSYREQVVDLVQKVINYAVDGDLFASKTREPTDQERLAFRDLANRFEAMTDEQDAESLQFQVYEVGKSHGFDPLRSWFQALYECLLGSSSGPRFGALAELYGVDRMITMLRNT